MNEYRCLKKEVWFRSHMFKQGDIYTGEPPVCGKGTDLTKGDNPCFELIGESKGKPSIPERKDTDERTDAEIRDDIWAKYGEKVHPNMKRENLLAKEKMLMYHKGKDAQMAETDYEVV